MEDKNLPTTAIVSVVEAAPVSADALQRQVNAIQEAMKKVMKEGVHFGKIPGCGEKPALLKAGAEKICMMFRLLPELEIQRQDLPGGHREYMIITTLRDPSGVKIGQGVGSCSTMESKYRWRKGEPEPTGRDVPKSYWNVRKQDPKAAQALLGGSGFIPKKIGGAWFIFKISDQRVENPDIADVYNTVLKMAKKRSHVDACITCTAASDIFTQDIDESVEPVDGEPAEGGEKPAPVQSAPEKKPTPPLGQPNDGINRPYRYDSTKVRRLTPDAESAKEMWKNMKSVAHAIAAGNEIHCSMAIPGLEDALITGAVDGEASAIQNAMGNDTPAWEESPSREGGE